MDGREKAIDQLQQVDGKLAALLGDLENCDIEPSAFEALRSTLQEMHATVRALLRGIEHSRLSPDDQTFMRSLIGEQLRHASELNVDVRRNVEAGRIRTDQLGMSTYLRVLNQTMDQLDALLGSRQIRSLPAPKTVLLVDDEDILRKMVRDFLEELGWRVLEASRAIEGIQIARAHTAKIDLLLTDIEIPGMSGWELAKRMVELEPSIRVVYMSGGIFFQDWVDSKQRLARSHFIQKPFRLKELKDLLVYILSE